MDETTPERGASTDDATELESTPHVERVQARGHDNVSGVHASTFEVTTDDWLTPAGDCILAVEADRAPADFDLAFVEACRDPEATLAVRLAVYPGERDPASDTAASETTVEARGDPGLSFDSDRSAVVRTSDYVDDRTVAVGADAAAADLDRDLVEALSDPATDLVLELRVDG